VRYERLAGSPGARRWARPHEKVLVHISNFRPIKRVWDVVAVFHRLRERLPVRLLLVGDGPERSKIEQHCREAGTCGVEEVLVGADCFLLPSENESFGLAALEAMACRVPVVATAVGGLPEVVTDGESGFLRPVGDVGGMAAAAERLLTDDALRARFAAAAQERARREFSVAPVVARYRAVYERALAAAPAGA
jgi:N-acetyl-alpha-D-glucosaminyl L-malate synthase BshA